VSREDESTGQGGKKSLAMNGQERGRPNVSEEIWTATSGAARQSHYVSCEKQGMLMRKGVAAGSGPRRGSKMDGIPGNGLHNKSLQLSP
jgi:hypothetical protein